MKLKSIKILLLAFSLLALLGACGGGGGGGATPPGTDCVWNSSNWNGCNWQ